MTETSTDPAELVKEAREWMKTVPSYSDLCNLITRLADALEAKADAEGIHRADTLQEHIFDLDGENALLRARVEALEGAIRWALGEDEGDPQFPGPEVRIAGRIAPFGWRTELRRRAALTTQQKEP